MVHLCRELHDEALRLLQLHRSLIIIGKCLLPFFIQFAVPVLQAHHHVQELRDSLFQLFYFFFILFPDILQHVHPLFRDLLAGERESVPLFLQLLDGNVLLPDDPFVIRAQLLVGLS